MTKQVYCVLPTDSIARVKNLLLKHRISTVLVLEGDEPVGMVGEKDVADAFYHTREPVDEVRVQEIMVKKVVTVPPEATPEEVAKKMIEEKTKGVIVFDEVVLGIMTKTDLLGYFISKYTGRALVGDVMDTNIRTIKPRHSLFHAIRKMQEEEISRILVVEDGLKGILSMKDVAFVSPSKHPTRLIFAKPSKKPAERAVRIMPYTVEEIMRTEVHKISPVTAASKAAKLMLEKGIGSLVVVDSRGNIKGMLTKTDITRYLSNTIS